MYIYIYQYTKLAERKEVKSKPIIPKEKKRKGGGGGGGGGGGSLASQPATQ